MKRLKVLVVSALVAAALASPLNAQQNLGDLDGDGVPNLQDRCPNTPRGSRVDVSGCPQSRAAATPAQRDTVTPSAGLKGRRPTPTLVGRPGAAAQPAAPAPTPAAAAGRPSLVTPQAAQPAPRAEPPASPPAAAQPAAAGGFTAGLAMAPFTGGAMPARLEYARRAAQMLDSTIITLVGVFRNTSGQPLGGAADTASLSLRERDRWRRCRDLHWDLTTYAEAVSAVSDSLGADLALQRAAAGLDTALSDLQATAECDNVASMIAAPTQWQPWQQQYESSARSFYGEWYAQIRNVHEKDRTFVIALNAALPAARRLAVPPGLPRNPPYAGAALR
ncbi:MAG: thrombospondin type 3 repeat-containing protein [Gemmatimonadales bacterium]|nr:thrombospondin type 3 repeat-containing protein [Gemmatimonadales bacterium]